MKTTLYIVLAVLLVGSELYAASSGEETLNPERCQYVLQSAAYDTMIARMVSYVNPDSIAVTIGGLEAFGTRRWDQPNRDAVCSWIVDRMAATGLADVRRDTFTYSSTLQQNVVATLPGKIRPDIVLVVGGHYDSQSSNPADAPGADDNASGTAAVIEMARILIESHYEPAVTMKFIAFAAEEAGLIGSKHYAETAKFEGVVINAMLNYDMIGYRDQGSADRDVYLIWYEGAMALADLHAAMAVSYTTLTPVYTWMYRSQSDSWPFFQQGYPAVFSIERDFNPFYHTPGDISVVLDMPYAADIVRTGLATLLTLDQVPGPVHQLSVADRGNGTSLLVRWERPDVSDISGFIVRVTSSSDTLGTTVATSDSWITLDGLEVDTTYHITVATIDIAGLVSPVTAVEGIPRLVPAAPHGLHAEGIVNAVRVGWDPNTETDLAGYHIYRRVGSQSFFVRLTVEPSGDTLWVDTLQSAGVYWYRVSAVDTSGFESNLSDSVQAAPVVRVEDAPDLANGYRLDSNFPNPFNPSTTIRYTIPTAERVTITVYSTIGAKVRMLVDAVQQPGNHEVGWDATGMSSGIYLVVMRTPGFYEVRRMVLTR